MNRFTCALITVLAASAPAFADDSTTSTEATGTGGASGDASANPNGGGAGGGMNANATTAVDGTMVTGWSPLLLYAPQTMPAHGIGLDGTLSILRRTFPAIPPATTGSTTTIETLGVAAAYGINEKITAGLSYAFDLHPGSAKGPFDIYGAYNVMHKDKMSLTAGADFGFDINKASTTKAIGLGASFKYIVAPKIAVYTGNPIPIGPAGDQLSFTLASKGPIDLKIPAGVALQPIPKLFAYVDLLLMNLGIANSSNAFIFKDQIRVNVGALYRATPDLDVGLAITDDFKNAGDSYTIAVTGRYYIHK